ncbi:MAG TPA: hypothetical protein VLI90_13550, partial [Tepidisphaeraceae bacterium]|nr:hypothetical protein [Tepidisphaeraceae bacterium]
MYSTIVLNSLNDSGPGTLRDAVATAASGDTIDASALSGTIALTSGQLQITTDVSIVGPGADSLMLDGGGLDRLVTVAGGTTVSLAGLTFTHGGNVAAGGAIFSDGALTLDHVIVNANTASATGGGIFENSGSLTIVDSTISNNSIAATADAAGGGVFAQAGTLSITGSTFAGNTAQAAGAAPGASNGFAARGGAIDIETATASITNCTFTGNTAQGGDDVDLAAI